AFELPRVEVANGVQKSRLDAGEREVEPGNACNGKGERLRVALAREAVDRRAARIAEAEQARALVERLTRGVVDRRAEDARWASMLLHVEQQGVTPAREQAEKRRFERIGLEVERPNVPVEVVDRCERQPARPGDRLRGRDPD